MSKLAGFDFVCEISNATIKALIQSKMTIGGVKANPPFELTLPFSGGSAHLIIDKMELDLNDDDTMSLSFIFSQASVSVQSPITEVICPLSGTLAAKIPLGLTAASGNAQQITANTGAATVSLTYTPEAEAAINSTLAGTGFTSAQFHTVSEQALTNFIHNVPSVMLPMAFNVLPGTNGSIAPLRFTGLQVHCIGNSDRNLQALGLFGNLLASTQTNGNHADKTATSIESGRDVAISFSPGAFHSLVFCPAVAKALGVSLNALPTSCGSSSGVPVSGITLTSISDSFADGKININGSVKDSGTCYDASGTFSGNITLSVSGTTLTPAINMDKPDISIDIPWYCYLAVTLGLGPLGAISLFMLDQIADSIASNLAASVLKDSLGSSISGISVGALSNATFASVAVTPEGLTLQGDIQVFVPQSTFHKSLALSGSTTTSSKTAASEGTWTTRLSCQPEDHTYPYTEYLQTQVAVYNLVSSMLATPLSATYTVYSPQTGGGEIPLTGTSGSVEIQNVECTYMLPLGTGGTKVKQTVHLDYQINGTLLILSNRAEEGNFAVYVEATVHDCTGNLLMAVPNNYPPGSTVYFHGETVEIGGGYLEDYQECAARMDEIAKEISEKYKKWKPAPIWVQINYPPEERLIDQMRTLKSWGIREAQDMLVHSRLAHGPSFVRAYHAPAERQLGRALKVTEQTFAFNALELNLRGQINLLTTQLSELEKTITLGSLKQMFDQRTR